ncbi:MAG: HEPN domain-containing protein [Planctomycetes bacterium]|nr:HEPN domain-containing protein [Planctomycetota bacterium]
MAFDWWDFLELADELHKGANQKSASKIPHREARLRTVVSRAYYAALKSISELLTDKHKFPEPPHASHHAIKQALEVHARNVPEYKQVLAKLTALQSARTFADYKSDPPKGTSLEDLAQLAIDDAMDLRPVVKKLHKKKA